MKHNKIAKIILSLSLPVLLTACNSQNEIKESAAPDIYTIDSTAYAEEKFIPVCKHESIYEETIKATCTADGSCITYCKDCNKVLVEKTLYKTGHLNTEEKTQEAFCETAGYTRIVCSDCGTCISESVIPAKDHTWNEWMVTVKANPFTNGSMTRACSICGKEEKKEYAENIGDTHLYIPSVNIDSDITAGTITQECVDANNAVYGVFEYNGGFPCITGHNNKVLKTLRNVCVGDHIWLWVNGEVKEYEVYVAEAAVYDRDNTHDIVGNNTTDVTYLSADTKDLRLYTCLTGKIDNNRFLVLAREI